MKDEHQSLVARYAASQLDLIHLSALRIHIRIKHLMRHLSPDVLTRSDADDQDPSHHRLRVCDECNEIIHTPDQYFYGCPLCSNFFVHDYCNNYTSFPTILSTCTVSTHTRDHILRYRGSIKPFICSHCRCEYTGASYICMDDRCRKEGFRLDVSCAFMPGFITHGVHNAAHFMRLTTTTTTSRDRACDCCRRPLGNLFYECRTCPDFALHTWCATLPETVTHKFDNHPLTLTTTTTTSAAAAEMVMICEICENGMESDGAWYYSCSECDQSFHVDCIPRLDLMHKMKSLADDDPDVRLPTRLIRGLTLQGHAHDYYAHVADEYDILQPYS